MPMFRIDKVSVIPPFGNRDGAVTVTFNWSGDYDEGVVDFSKLALPNFNPGDILGPEIGTAADGKDVVVTMDPAPTVDDLGIVRLYVRGTSTEASSTVATTATSTFKWLRTKGLRGAF